MNNFPLPNSLGDVVDVKICQTSALHQHVGMVPVRLSLLHMYVELQGSGFKFLHPFESKCC